MKKDDSYVMREIEVARSYITIYQAAWYDRSKRAEQAAITFLEQSLNLLRTGDHHPSVKEETKREITKTRADIENILKRHQR